MKIEEASWPTPTYQLHSLATGEVYQFVPRDGAPGDYFLVTDNRTVLVRLRDGVLLDETMTIYAGQSFKEGRFIHHPQAKVIV